MNDKRATLEKIAPTIEEAINEGLEELGLSEGEVEIEVLDEGGGGFLGLGGRSARVRLTVKAEEKEISEAVEPETQPVSAPEDLDEETSNTMEIARATVVELLERMHVQANVSAHLGESDDPRYDPPIIVDINGRDLSILIGHHADTLNALQYVTRLIVGKELGRAAHLVVDVSGYRRRREQNLRTLARRMAEQAVKTGRTQSLEPMPPNERRIVHVELRDYPEVDTKSVGEDPRRKVTIIPAEDR